MCSMKNILKVKLELFQLCLLLRDSQIHINSISKALKNAAKYQFNLTSKAFFLIDILPNFLFNFDFFIIILLYW
jgi:hypothetical protein